MFLERLNRTVNRNRHVSRGNFPPLTRLFFSLSFYFTHGIKKEPKIFSFLGFPYEEASQPINTVLFEIILHLHN